MIRIQDEYGQTWNIFEDDANYQEAKVSIEKGIKTWPLEKILEGRGWGWWTVFKDIDDYEREIGKIIPDPVKNPLIQTDHEYTPTELSDMLQQLGSYLSILYAHESKVEAHCNALREGFKTGLQVAMARYETESKTVKGQEAEILSGNELFLQTKRMEIKDESILLVISGWRKAYEQAYATISRIVSLRIGEVSLQTGRHP